MNVKQFFKLVGRGFIAAAAFAFLILFSGCESNGNEEEINRLEARSDSLSGHIVKLDSMIDELTLSGPNNPTGEPICKDVFPDQGEANYVFLETQSSSNTKKVYDINLEGGCPYDLSSFSKCCKCTCSIDYITVTGSVSDGDVLIVSMRGSSSALFSNRSLTIVDGKIPLDAYGYDREWEAGMTYSIENPAGSMDGITCTAGGLCIVVPVEGGGN